MYHLHQLSQLYVLHRLKNVKKSKKFNWAQNVWPPALRKSRKEIQNVLLILLFTPKGLTCNNNKILSFLAKKVFSEYDVLKDQRSSRDTDHLCQSKLIWFFKVKNWWWCQYTFFWLMSIYLLSHKPRVARRFCFRNFWAFWDINGLKLS